MADFDVGVVVQLKSGGPKMTIHSVGTSDDKVFCQWFAGNKMESGYFPKQSLIIVSESENRTK